LGGGVDGIEADQMRFFPFQACLLWLLFTGDEEFSEIALADIAQHRNGWTDQPLRLRKTRGTTGAQPLQSDAR
jgi:hypothetical protein